MAKADLTIRTALLEGRYVWGDQALYEEASRRFFAEVVPGTERQFVSEKLEERDLRPRRDDERSRAESCERASTARRRDVM